MYAVKMCLLTENCANPECSQAHITLQLMKPEKAVIAANRPSASLCISIMWSGNLHFNATIGEYPFGEPTAKAWLLK